MKKQYMSRYIFLDRFIVLLIIFFFSGCQVDKSEESKKELIKKFEEMSVAITKGDLDEFVSHYAESPIHLPPGAQTNSSKEDIKTFLSDKLGLYVIDGEPKISFSDDASMAYLFGRYHIDEDSLNGIEFVEGRFITIWKKTEGKWSCVVDIWNSPNAKYEHL